MDQDDVNEIISKSCPDWKAEQIRHGNGCYNQPINKRKKPMKKKTLELIREWVVAEIRHQHYKIHHRHPYEYHDADEKFEELVKDIRTDQEDDEG